MHTNACIYPLNAHQENGLTLLRKKFYSKKSSDSPLGKRAAAKGTNPKSSGQGATPDQRD
ncbi:MAG: hypothetical protein ACI8SR_002374 [Oceanicoccus sp.]|jgi:hypothetical protein